jgi:hypothetical protein
VINNTNVALETTAQMVEDSQAIVEQAADMLGVEVIGITAVAQVISKMSDPFIKKHKNLIKPINIHMRPEWLDEKQ